ncbi:recombination protein NinB [Salmonella enterica]|nr:recombination protein NinB [Salmonella enterica subsp. enterica serovar Ohio]
MKCVKYHLTNESIRYNAIQYLRTCDLDIIVEFKQRNRSLDQNRKLWACLGDVSRQVNWHGRWLDAESWKCVFTAALKQQDVVPNLSGNGFVVIGQSTSRMRVSEFAELLELIQAFGTERGVKWSDEARLALEWKRGLETPHETLLPLRRKQRRLSIPAKSTLLAPMVYQM